jgi:outer membrane lipoprotein SlyB
MKSLPYVLALSGLVLHASATLAQQAGQSITLQYGTITGVAVVEDKGQRTGGTIVGGLVGGAIAKDHRGLGMIAGGLLGGGIGKHVTKKMLQQYTVKLVKGGVELVLTEQENMVIGDCVVVEQGQYANLRRVSSINCAVDQQPQHHVDAAKNCDKAKGQMADAKTNDEIEQALIKVRTLCED